MNLDHSLNIPGKCHYKFHELTAITNVKPYVLRFWETEFAQIAPIVDEQGNKLYSQNDIDVINIIKVLLFEQHLSIPQAKVRMEDINQSLALGFEETIDEDARALSEELEFTPMPAPVPVRQNIATPIDKINQVKVQLRNTQSMIDRIKVRQGWGLSL